MSTTYQILGLHPVDEITVEGDSVTHPPYLRNLSWAHRVRPALETLNVKIIPLPDHPYEITSRGETYRFRWVGNKLMSVYEIEPGGKWREMEYEEIPEHIKELL